MSKELVEVSGTIFKRQKYKEADILAKIFSKELGIFTILVHGALRPKSKMGADTLNFSTGTFVVMTNKHGISVLRTIKKAQQLDYIYNDLNANAYVSFIFDLADHAFEEYQNLGSYFNLVEQAVNKINDKQDPEIITDMVELKLLTAYGVQPELRRCVICGRTTGAFDYSIKLGGIICSRHFSLVTDRMHLKPKETALIRTLGLLSINQLGNIQVSTTMKKSIRKAIDRIFNHTVDLDLKSKRFLDEIQAFNENL